MFFFLILEDESVRASFMRQVISDIKKVMHFFFFLRILVV